MSVIVLFVFVITCLLVMRTIMINKENQHHRVDKEKVETPFFIIGKFILKEIRLLLMLYVGTVGLYIFLERTYQYAIYPSHTKVFKAVYEVLQTVSANDFVSRLYVMLIGVYIVILLPYRIIKGYSDMLNKTKTKDIVHIYVNGVLMYIRKVIAKEG